MERPVDSISITGFKSIRVLEKLKLSEINVLVGSNGAGKSNFVDMFRMLRAMSEGGLKAFVTKHGGADGFFFNGPKETSRIKCHLALGEIEYKFSLEPTVSGDLVVSEEAVYVVDEHNWRPSPAGKTEANLPNWRIRDSSRRKPITAHEHLYEALSGWVVYHFHDTSLVAPMRRDQSVRDWRELRPDASNIAAFLLKMREENPARYERIRKTVELIAPFFDDFLLEPQRKGQNELIRLEWRQKGSTFPFQPWHFSDGTLRFVCLATALLQPKMPSTIVIDEPELGLHPFALEMLAQVIKEAAEQTQLILSTQSAPLLSHFEPEQVIIVDRASGASRFRRLEPEPFKVWLEDYTLGELLEKNVIEAGPGDA